MRPLDDNNAEARPIARGIGRAAHDRGHGSEEITRRCPFLGGCAPHGSGQRIHSGPAVANAKEDNLGQALFFHRSDPTLRVGIQVRAPRRQRQWFNLT